MECKTCLAFLCGHFKYWAEHIFKTISKFVNITIRLHKRPAWETSNRP